MTVSPKLLELLACPRCRGSLDYREKESCFVCQACSLKYPVRDDIPIMLVDEATPA